MPRPVIRRPQTALFGIRSCVLIVKKAATPTLNPNTPPTVGMAAKLVPRPSHSLVVPKERTRLFRLRIQQQVGRASESVTGTTRPMTNAVFWCRSKVTGCPPKLPAPCGTGLQTRPCQRTRAIGSRSALRIVAT